MHFPRNGRQFCSYINFYNFETFLTPKKTFVDIFIGLLQEIILKIFSFFTMLPALSKKAVNDGI